MTRLRKVTVVVLLAAVALSLAALAKQAKVSLQEGLYAEQVEGNLDAAIKIYEQVIQDSSAPRSAVAQAMYRQGMCYLKKQQRQRAREVFGKLVAEYSDQTSVVSKVKSLLEELGNADPAALMPPDTLVYVELGSPGKQVETILNMLKGTPFENPLAMIGANHGQPQQRSGSKGPGDIVGALLNPSMMAEFKKIRGMGVGITGIAQKHPSFVLVLFPGKSDALRGILQMILGVVGRPAEAMEGMQCVSIPDSVTAAYDDNVVIVTQGGNAADSLSQLRWSVRQYKGLTHEPTLASSNTSFAKVGKKDRQENALTVWANVDEVFTELTKVFPEGRMPEGIQKANALADFKNINDLIAFLSIHEDGVALEANVSFKNGHNCVAYNMIRTPRLNKNAFKAIPSEAIALLAVGLDGAESAQAQMLRQQIKNAIGLEIGGDIFANIKQVTLFALPVDGTSKETLPGVPPIITSLGLSLTSPHPQQTRRILTGLLTAANLMMPESGNEPAGTDNGRYRLDLVNGLTLYCYTDEANNATVLSLNPKVIEAVASAAGSGKSAVAAGPLREAVNKLSPATSKLVLVNVGGAIRAGGAQLLSGVKKPEGKVSDLLAQLAGSCDKTTIQLRTLEEPNRFDARAEINQLPPVSKIYGPMMQLSQTISEAKAKARSEKTQASIPASIRETAQPPTIDGNQDDIWSGARAYKIGNVIYSPPSSDTDFSAHYKALWDQKNLYLLVDVTDDSLKNDSGPELWYQDDCVEVFIDGDNSKSGSYDDDDYQFHFNWDRSKPTMGETRRGGTDNVEFAMVTTDKGYRTEIKFPWASLGVKPSAGTKIGLDVHANDDDDGGDRDTKLTWWGKEDNAWQTPSAFGTAELAGLVGWWKLDETEGNTAADSSENGHAGHLTGDPHWRPAGGKINGALEFDGVDDYVDTGYDANLSTWTVAVWVKSPAAPSSEGEAGPVHREKNYQINWNHPNGAFRGAAGVSVGGRWYGAGFGDLQANTWYYLVATYDGENLKAYRDAVLITNNRDPSGPPDAESESLKFGRHASSAHYFRGTIDDVRIYNYALSEEQIKALYDEAR
jgi:Carbohydrate family 9 binding domain-like/Concanavalin A-like lectin/glucanases superfamily/Tetratricopeptide repeat